MGEWRYNSTVLDLSTRRRSVVSFSPGSPYIREKLPRYALDRRLGGHHNRFGCCGEEKNLTPDGIRNPAVQPVARRYTD
jgi:hypothetical protein